MSMQTMQWCLEYETEWMNVFLFCIEGRKWLNKILLFLASIKSILQQSLCVRNVQLYAQPHLSYDKRIPFGLNLCYQTSTQWVYENHCDTWPNNSAQASCQPHRSPFNLYSNSGKQRNKSKYSTIFEPLLVSEMNSIYSLRDAYTCHTLCFSSSADVFQHSLCWSANVLFF